MKHLKIADLKLSQKLDVPLDENSTNQISQVNYYNTITKPYFLKFWTNIHSIHFQIFISFWKFSFGLIFLSQF